MGTLLFATKRIAVYGRKAPVTDGQGTARKGMDHAPGGAVHPGEERYTRQASVVMQSGEEF